VAPSAAAAALAHSNPFLGALRRGTGGAGGGSKAQRKRALAAAMAAASGGASDPFLDRCELGMLLQATRALAKLAENADCRRAFSDPARGNAATLPALISILRHVGAAPIVRNAAYCLELLSKKKEVRLPLMRAGAVPALVHVLRRLFRGEGMPPPAEDGGGGSGQAPGAGGRRRTSIHTAEAEGYVATVTTVSRRENDDGGGAAARREAALKAAANSEVARMVSVALAWFAKVRSRWHEMLDEGVVAACVTLCEHTDDRTAATHAALCIGRLAELPSNRPAVLADGGKVGLLTLSRRATEHVVLSNANWALNQLPEGAVDFGGGSRSSVVQQHAHKQLTQGASVAVTGAENDRLRGGSDRKAPRAAKKKGGGFLPVL
jgi:hypothetical protein